MSQKHVCWNHKNEHNTSVLKRSCWQKTKKNRWRWGWGKLKHALSTRRGTCRPEGDIWNWLCWAVSRRSWLKGLTLIYCKGPLVTPDADQPPRQVLICFLRTNEGQNNQKGEHGIDWRDTDSHCSLIWQRSQRRRGRLSHLWNPSCSSTTWNSCWPIWGRCVSGGMGKIWATLMLQHAAERLV